MHSVTQMALPGVVYRTGDKFAGTLSLADKRQTRETRICIGQNLTTRGERNWQAVGWMPWRLAKSVQVSTGSASAPIVATWPLLALCPNWTFTTALNVAYITRQCQCSHCSPMLPPASSTYTPGPGIPDLTFPPSIHRCFRYSIEQSGKPSSHSAPSTWIGSASARRRVSEGCPASPAPLWKGNLSLNHLPSSLCSWEGWGALEIGIRRHLWAGIAQGVVCQQRQFRQAGPT